MREKAQLQTFARSRIDETRLCSFDIELVESPTKPLIHSEARFLLVRSGSGCISIQNRPFEIDAGCFLAFLPWQLTEITRVDEPLRYYLVIFNLYTLNRMIKAFGGEVENSAAWMSHIEASPVLKLSRQQQLAMERCFHAIRDEVGLESTLDAPSARPLRELAVMNRLSDIVISYERFGMSNSDDFGQGVNRDLSEILRYMYCHCGEKLTLGKLSKLFFASEGSISSYINSLTGLSFFDLLNEIRIGKTVNYLLYTDLNIEEISSVLGYVDGPHLSKVFSARTGMRLGEYRRNYRKISAVCNIEDDRLPYTVVQYICRHYSEPLSAQKVSSMFELSVTELNRLLLYQVEKNFDDFLNSIRIDKACELLLTTDDSITYISMAVGYANAKTFTRHFLRQKVTTPGEFRKFSRLEV